jgi:hypothetical protein
MSACKAPRSSPRARRPWPRRGTCGGCSRRRSKGDRIARISGGISDTHFHSYAVDALDALISGHILTLIRLSSATRRQGKFAMARRVMRPPRGRSPHGPGGSLQKLTSASRLSSLAARASDAQAKCRRTAKAVTATLRKSLLSIGGSPIGSGHFVRAMAVTTT